MNRVRKARRSSKLSCGHYALTGQLIVSRDRGPWTCLPCALAALSDQAAQEAARNKRAIDAGVTFAGHKPPDWRRR